MLIAINKYYYPQAYALGHRAHRFCCVFVIDATRALSEIAFESAIQRISRGGEAAFRSRSAESQKCAQTVDRRAERWLNRIKKNEKREIEEAFNRFMIASVQTWLSKHTTNKFIDTEYYIVMPKKLVNFILTALDDVSNFIRLFSCRARFCGASIAWGMVGDR